MKKFSNLPLIVISLTFLLTSCDSGYKEVEGKIYYNWVHGGNWTAEKTLLEEADASSFVTIEHDLNLHLGKDKDHVFKDASLLEHAEPNTFQQIKGYFWKDKNHVYLLQYGGADCRIKTADPETFSPIEEYNWGKDKSNVYFEFKKLSGVNAKKFIPIDAGWGRDDKYYFYQDMRLEALHYNTAEIVSSYYIKDKDHVYFKNVLVKDANPKTFKADGIGWFGHDDENMYDWERNLGPITDKYRQTYIARQKE